MPVYRWEYKLIEKTALKYKIELSTRKILKPDDIGFICMPNHHPYLDSVLHCISEKLVKNNMDYPISEVFEASIFVWEHVHNCSSNVYVRINKD